MTSRLYPSRPFLASSVAVFRDGKVLLAARNKPPGAQRFSLPGGIVELGETLEQAALRELFEEVAVKARIIAFNDHVEVIDSDETGRLRQHFVVASFVAHWLAGEPKTSDEAEAVLWADPDDIGGLPVTPGLGRILLQAKRIWALAA